MNIWQSYKQERGYLVHFVRLATKLLSQQYNSFKSHLKTHLFAHHEYPLSSCHLATASASDSSPVLDYYARYQVFVYTYVCMYSKKVHETIYLFARNYAQYSPI